jgi:LDH2 family malate/lactate/ureidoglycolate dehydrogenase
MAEEFIVVGYEALTRFAAEVMKATGVPGSTSTIVAESLVSANLRGVDSHGVQLLLWYTDQIRGGNVDVNEGGYVASESGACLVYDGANGIGQLISTRCCNHAIRLAKDSGIGMVVARNSTHFGACAWWAQKLSAAGMLGIVMCNATALVAPWQARDKMLGTNPVCMSVPGPNTFLLDMATTTVALNKIYKALLSGDASIPEGWAMDRDGKPTTDPKAAIEGLPTPLGGYLGGYKGSGLAVMVEILCAVLSGGVMLNNVGGIRVKSIPMGASHMFLAIDVARFMPMEQFTERMEWLRETITHAAPANGFDDVMIAGDPEWRMEAIRLRDGIPVSRGIWEQLTALADSLSVSVP